MLKLREYVRRLALCGFQRVQERDELAAMRMASARRAIAEVSADKAYGSVRNAEAIAFNGGTPFIALKRTTPGAVGMAHGKRCSATSLIAAKNSSPTITSAAMSRRRSA